LCGLDVVAWSRGAGAAALHEAPPASGESEREIDPSLGSHALEEEEEAIPTRGAVERAPAVGDLLILNPGGTAVGHGDEHTAMIDRVSGSVPTTIEGEVIGAPLRAPGRPG
jgi:hypothetical protein